MAGLHAVPDDHVATIVTTLEMRTRPPLRPMPASPLRLTRWDAPAPDRYRTLFRRVGARWLWYSRLVMDDAALTAIIARQGNMGSGAAKAYLAKMTKEQRYLRDVY